MDLVVTKDMILLSRHVLEYLGVEYKTSGEGFQSKIHYTVPQVYRNEPINVTLDKLKLMNSTVDAKRALRGALSIIDEIPLNVKRIFWSDLDMIKGNEAHNIIQLYIKIAVIFDDTNGSLPKYNEWNWNGGGEITFQDYTQALLTTKLVHSQDTYTWDVRYNDVWTDYDAITKIIQHIESRYVDNIETINKFSYDGEIINE